MRNVAPVERRSLIAAVMTIGGLVLARPVSAAVPEPFTRIPLWPHGPPGGEGVNVTEAEVPRNAASAPGDTAFIHVRRPTLNILRPARPNGAGLLLIPGGAYHRVSIGQEGYAVARHFAALGFTCFILVYRLPGDGWGAGAQAPLQDAQRALRMARADMMATQLDPDRIGVIGFSAGGHLAGWLAARGEAESYAPVDRADALALRLKVAGLLYPVISMAEPDVHMGSRTGLLGKTPTAAQINAHSIQNAATASMPPVFFAHALDDKAVPPENSLLMLAALRSRAVPAEAHLFEKGGHGFALTLPDGQPSPWPALFTAFAQRHGLL